MAFAFVAAGHYDSSSSASAVVPVPAGTAANDLMLCILKKISVVANSIPSGWAHLGDFTTAGGSNFALYWKLAGGSEPADYTWGYAAAGRLGGTMVSYRDGFNTADPIDVVSNTSYVTSDTILRAAGMTVTAANSPLVFLGGTHTSAGQTFTPATNPTTFAEDVDAWFGAGSRFAREIASVVWAGSGATGDMDATISGANADKHAFAVALNPAAGGAITGSVETSFSVVGVLTGVGALVGSIALALTPTGTLAGTGALSSNIQIESAVSGVLSGAGALSGDIPLALDVAGTLTGAGALIGAVPLEFTPTGTLTGAGALAGSVSLALDVTGTIADLGGGAMSGAVPLDFTVTGLLTGAGALSGSTELAFDVAGTLTGAGALAGAVPLELSVSGTLIDLDQGAIIGSVQLGLSVTGTLTGTGALLGSISSAFDLSGVLIDLTPPDAEPEATGGKEAPFRWWIRYEQDMLRREDERRRLEESVDEEISALMRGEDAPKAEASATEYLEDLSALVEQAQAREAEFRQFVDGLNLKRQEGDLARLMAIDRAMRQHLKRLREEEEFIQILLLAL